MRDQRECVSFLAPAFHIRVERADPVRIRTGLPLLINLIQNNSEAIYHSCRIDTRSKDMLFDAHSDEVTKWTKVIEIEEKKIQVTFDATFSA